VGRLRDPENLQGSTSLLESKCQQNGAYAIHQSNAEERLKPMGEETRAQCEPSKRYERTDRVLIVEDEDNRERATTAFAALGLRTLWAWQRRKKRSRICELPARHADRRRRIARDEWA